MQRAFPACYFNTAAKHDDIFIHPNEIVSFNIYFDGQKMEKDEYLSVCQELLNIDFN